VHIAQINVNYTIYYPLSEKYISLYPQDKKKKTTSDNKNQNDSDDDSEIELPPKCGHKKAADTKNEKPPLWPIVEKCTANGTLDQLRNGKLNIGFDGKPKPIPNPKTESTALSSSSSLQKNREKAGSQGTKRSDLKTASKTNQQYDEPEEDDSDGGFFET
jgi:hypothetical protein